MAPRHQVTRRQGPVASPILSLLRTRRPFRLVVVVLLVLFLFKNLPRAVVDRFQKDTGLETSEDPPAFLQEQQRSSQGQQQPSQGQQQSSPGQQQSFQGQQRSSQGLPYKISSQPTPKSLKSRPILGKHRFLADGLVEVNEDGAHPIYELISRAEKEWEKKLKRASKTLTQAVNEYRRRYKRHPPKGFDLW